MDEQCRSLNIARRVCQGAAGRPKLWVERQPFLASQAVIFGVNPTGPHILVVNLVHMNNAVLCCIWWNFAQWFG